MDGYGAADETLCQHRHLQHGAGAGAGNAAWGGRGWLVVRGLNPRLLSGFAAIGLPDALAVYQASLVLAEPVWPREPGWTGAARRFSDSEHRLLEFGVALATHPAVAVGAVTGRLTDWCVRILGVHAAVILTTATQASGRAAVVSASDERARLAAVVGLGSMEGPVVECLLRGEPVSAPTWALALNSGLVRHRGAPA
jgi:hypothetical protein